MTAQIIELTRIEDTRIKKRTRLIAAGLLTTFTLGAFMHPNIYEQGRRLVKSSEREQTSSEEPTYNSNYFVNSLVCAETLSHSGEYATHNLTEKAYEID